ncbi:hypothetical protein NCS57_00370800 [Fusarium keratoplasticum]|uniref:Uncharacterized protein n=1 Tax=Fusarium keratoplasticum TaxID=1328300 RepID=A0ACC0R334_9HYPO|nr:hypothetical protein NCS57_00370800 [Fusarium keratoplasticum]KAI8674721.1 hypothetical protein NCS57_00370800 [Fusarium keratoplasticum]
MHYIRFLRAPKVLKNRRGPLVQLLFTITTDLGDSFLYPERFLDLQVVAVAASPEGSSTWLLSDPGHLDWEPGMRVAKPALELPVALERALETGMRVHICVRAAEPIHTAESAPRVLALAAEKMRYRKEAAAKGAVMPAWVPLMATEPGSEVSIRRLQLGDSPDGLGTIELEEEIGESIARHVWDAGVVATSAIVGIETAPDSESSNDPCMRTLKNIFSRQRTIRVLELGCGVGILSVGLAAVYPQLHAPSPGDCTILMTDLPEAEERARSNMKRVENSHVRFQEKPVRMMYENLDWEEGRQGRFGPQARSQPWDLVMLSDCTYNVDMLPALVETLSAIHANNLTHFPEGEPFTTKVFLATKPRHESEEVLFELMDKDGWYNVHRQVMPLPVLGGAPQSVELYLFDKSGLSEDRDQRRGEKERERD